MALRSPYEIKAGAIIPTSLITGINSDLPGQIVGQVRENVYDTVTGNYLLIPQGSRLLATYDSVVSFGQERVLVCWNRLIRPDGVSIGLECMPGVDLSGYAGFADDVDHHWFRIITGVALETLLSATAQRSHRNILAEAKTFLKWSRGKGYLRANPLEGVEGTGKRRQGKPQLRIDEARRWQAKAMQLADEGATGAIAALVTLVMGLRAGEVVSRVVRDLDDEGRLLWIPDSKTEAGKRTLQVPVSCETACWSSLEGRRRRSCCSATTIEIGRGSGWPRSARRQGCRG